MRSDGAPDGGPGDEGASLRETAVRFGLRCLTSVGDELLDPSLVGDRAGSASRPTTIATLGRGQCFGEVALVDQGLLSASARSASHETRLLIIPRQSLMDLCERDPALGFRLMRNLAADLATKIRNTDLLIREELLYSQRGARAGNES